MFTRGVAGFFGLLTLLNLVARILGSGQDNSIWWIDLRFMGSGSSLLIEAAAACSFLTYAWLPIERRGVRRFQSKLFLLLGGVAAWNAIGVWRASGHSVTLKVPIPFSLAIAGLMLWFVWSTKSGVKRQTAQALRWQVVAKFAGGFVTAAIALPLGLMLFFGTSDYRRPADAAVVFGAGVYPDGTPSQALSDRTETACRLYQQGRVKLLIFSGGPSRGSVHETEAMRQIALQQGVPESAIRLDPGGLNTDATVRNTLAIFEREGIRRVLAVSHHYHLPRVKMAYARAGIDVFTVPAEEAQQLLGLPRFVVREVAAIWFYWGKGLV